jgi:CBS domain-containing protein
MRGNMFDELKKIDARRLAPRAFANSEASMRVKDVMTKKVLSIFPQATVGEALDAMVRSHLSGLPVIDEAGSLVGVVSEGDFLRRGEIGTQKARPNWFADFFLPGKAAQAYAHTHGRRIDEIMSTDVATIGENAGLEEVVALMEKRRIKRLPVMADGKVIGIITRGDFVRTLALFVRQPYEEQLASDAEIIRDIEGELRAQKWAPVASIDIAVKSGVVSLYGGPTDERERNAIRVIAENVDGVTKVHDHMTWIGSYPGTILVSPEDEAKGRAA